jgi:hypothetical protein
MADEPFDFEFDVSMLDDTEDGAADFDLVQAFATKETMLHQDDPDELDLGAFDKLQTGHVGAPMQFLQNIMGEAIEVWRNNGKASYVCVLVWSHNRVTTDDVERFVASVRMCYSRFRNGEGRGGLLPKLVSGDYQILADRRQVLFEMHIMDDANWLAFQKERQAAAKLKRPSRQTVLNGVLKELLKP